MREMRKIVHKKTQVVFGKRGHLKYYSLPCLVALRNKNLQKQIWKKLKNKLFGMLINFLFIFGKLSDQKFSETQRDLWRKPNIIFKISSVPARCGGGIEDEDNYYAVHIKINGKDIGKLSIPGISCS